MSNILVLGYELPSLASSAIEARSYRTWQFVEPLLSDGHRVCLISSHTDDQHDVPHGHGAALTVCRLNLRRRGWLTQANRIQQAFNPDGVLAVMFNSALRATRLATDKPIWMDLYGDKLAETQIAEHVQNTDRGRGNMLRYLHTILHVGDVYSTCSTPQKYALVGQLGMASRLNRQTVGYEFVHAILPGASNAAADKVHITEATRLRSTLVPDDAFIVMWCGGYNVWTDVDPLFGALSEAMSRDPRVHFVSVGAGVKLPNNDSYERFAAKIEPSPHKARFHLLGWRPASEVPAFYRQADVGINLDLLHYETVLGTRTRMIEMMRHGLPVVTSLGCELSEIVRDQSLGLTFPIGDAPAFAQCLLTLAADDAVHSAMSTRALHYATNQLSFAETTRPFRQWARAPYHAPDHANPNATSNAEKVEHELRTLARGVLWRVWGLERGE